MLFVEKKRKLKRSNLINEWSLFKFFYFGCVLTALFFYIFFTSIVLFLTLIPAICVLYVAWKILTNIHSQHV